VGFAGPFDSHAIMAATVAHVASVETIERMKKPSERILSATRPAWRAWRAL
jgi:hypothetical protein